MIPTDIDLADLSPSLAAADVARIVALQAEPRTAALATLMPLLAMEHQQLLLDAAVQRALRGDRRLRQ
jgi:hypothetical protein